ncbi:hypothetical protein Ciccas_013484 [Cichlidogyrus casuarinus]|uniref:Peptidase S8/S53 domain-containing protein n=1 Tax=Cichlidogyrus casuarinus TaxID=1844966 RepID=A0ABD2PNJ2_9PLAT
MEPCEIDGYSNNNVIQISDGSVSDTSAGYDNNFGPLLAANIRGQNIQVMVLDDGLDPNHGDLRPNLNSDYILNFSREQSISGHHGTACAGLIAAAGGNYNCIVGGAPLAKLGGWLSRNKTHSISVVKMIGYPTTASQEAEALMSFLTRGIHVYSNSWGPADDGYSTGGPPLMSIQAIKKGVTAVSHD